MLAGISKLRIEKGDCIVVKNYETLDYLARVQLPLGFVVPLVFAPQGVQKLNRQDLLNLLEQLDQQDIPVLTGAEMPCAPL